ncbi:MAG: SEC-C metal-binding domain-containing protein, partial [Patescibacteria group bacterium]
YKKVVATGGLCVFGTERHESRRIDNQLRGRSGRQGDPGASQFFLSMDDDLMRIFGSSKMKSVMTTLGLPDDVPIENKMISGSIEQAQKRVEGNNFDIRKHLVEYDDVMNKHRETIYKERNQILDSGNPADGSDTDRVSTKTFVIDAIGNEINSVVKFHTSSNLESEWNLNEIYESINAMFSVPLELRKNLEDLKNEAGNNEEDNMSRSKIIGYLKKMAVEKYDELEKNINMLPKGESELEPMRQIERGILLRTIDTLWIEHLDTMQNLRTGIGLRGYGQRDPLIEYKRESIRLFRQLLNEIDKQVAYSIFKIGIVNPTQITNSEVPKANLQFSAPSKESSEKSPMEADAGLQERKADKIIEDKSHFDGERVGRNDPCPCGSGQKFKKCHGA